MNIIFSTNNCQLNNLHYLSKLNFLIMQKSKLRNISLVILGTIFLAACTSKTIVPDITVPSGNVSFSNDVVPIFTKSCAINGCHATGNNQPDLSAANAYRSLITMSLVDTINPAQSVIYKKISPGGSMSLYIQSPADPQTILYWIKQGAKNN